MKSARSRHDRRSASPLRLSGSQPFTQQTGVYMMIGERTNVAGSPKFAKLVKEGNYEAGGQRRSAAGRERRQRHRHLHGRGDDRRRRGDDALPLAPRERARGGEGAVHDRLLEVGGHRGGAQVPPGQGDRELDLAEGGRGEVPSRTRRRSCKYGAAVVVMAFDENGQAATLRRQDPHLRARVSDPRRRRRLPARGHHLRPEHPHGGHGHRGAQQLRRRLHRRHALDQGEPPAREGERRRVEHLLQLPRQQPRPRGDALGVPLPRHPRRHGHGHRQRGDARGVRGDRARAARTLVEDVLLNRRSDATERLVDFGERLKAASAGESPAAKKEEKSGARGSGRGAPFARAREGHRHIHRRGHRGGARQAGAPARGHRGPADGRDERRGRSLRRGEDVPPAGREVGARDEEGGRLPHVHSWRPRRRRWRRRARSRRRRARSSWRP